MHNHWEEMLPFYIAGTLPKNDTRQLESHLASCAECRKSLTEWQRIAEATRAAAASHMRDLPPLSPQVLSLASQQAGARANQPLTYDFARGANYRSRYRSSTITLVAAAFTVFLIGGLLTLLVLSGALPSIRIATPDSNVVLLPTETETPTPTESITPVPSETDMPPSATVVPSQTDIPATITPLPSQTDVPPTVTLVLPSTTPIPPSSTIVPPSATTVPPSVTPIPPSATTVPPSATPIPPSATTVPPTATNVPPTAVPPSATPQPQIIVIEPSATPVTPTQIIPTRVPPTTAPANLFIPPTDAQPPTESLLLPEGTEEMQLFSMQSMMAVVTCMAQGSVAGGAVDLYAGPGEEYAIVNSFTQGDELTALALSDNGWVRVQYAFDGANEGVGWVMGDQVFLNGDCVDLPLIRAEDLIDDPLTPESTETVVIEPELTADVSVEATSEAESTAEPVPIDDTLPTDSSVPAVVISVAVANLRAGPGTSYAIVSTARAGESLPVTAQMTTASGVWYRARKSGQTVWVSAGVVRLTPSGAFVPAAPTLTPSPTSEATDEPAPTDTVLSGTWSQTVTVLSVSCDVTPPAGGVVPVSLLVAGDLITVFDAGVGSPYTVSRVGGQTYGGGYTTASATVSVSLTFSTPTSYYGSAVATGTDGCVTQSVLSGVYGG